MGLRGCSTTHFIQTLKGGLVTKVQNIDPHRRPTIAYKRLKDIYEYEDAIRLQRPAPSFSTDLVYEKCKNTCSPVAGKTFQEVKIEINDEPTYDVDKDVGGDSEDATTLKQLQKYLKMEKRKPRHKDGKFNLDNVNEKQVEDDSDLYVPLINWKVKRSKTLNANRKCMNPRAHSSRTDITVKYEESFFPEDSMRIGTVSDSEIHVKVESLASEKLDHNVELDSFMDHNVELDSRGLTSDAILRIGCRYEDCDSYDISYDYLEDVKPISMIVPRYTRHVKLATLGSGSEKLVDLPPMIMQKVQEIQDVQSYGSLLPENPNSDVCIQSQCSSSVKELSPVQSSHETQVSDVATGDVGPFVCLDQEFHPFQFERKNEVDDKLFEPAAFLSIHDKNSDPYPHYFISLNADDDVLPIEDTVADGEQYLTYSLNINSSDCLSSDNYVSEELDKAKEQATAPSLCDMEAQCFLKNQKCDTFATLSISEPCQPPEKLLSTKKAISLSSQERLHLAMNSAELYSDSDECSKPHFILECRGKPIEKEAEKVTFVGSTIQNDEFNMKHKGPRQATWQEVIMGSRHYKKKSISAKGNQGDPRMLRSLPTLSTGCSSVQCCSENAITFSQQQMHGMETLAATLMDELKSMKDIIQQKLLCEALQIVPLENHADEIQLAINNATKVEKAMRKRLLMMMRDCTRFCKIMGMISNGASASNITLPQKRKKVVFADEAGGDLCRVKFFRYGHKASGY